MHQCRSEAQSRHSRSVKSNEAHLLNHAQLESLRMLTNHDMDSTSPFACLLVGQPTLRRRMKMGALAALDQRIGLRYAMAPMTNEETSSYLRHHLSLAGRSDTLFSDDATALIHQTSRGYPRAVNNLALQSLVNHSSPPTPRTKPSSTNPPPASPSPKSRQTEHHRDTLNTKTPPGTSPAGSFQPHTSSPTTPPSCSSSTPGNRRGSAQSRPRRMPGVPADSGVANCFGGV
jgi:hypothetical protein